jgi:hypothetical protein
MISARPAAAAALVLAMSAPAPAQVDCGGARRDYGEAMDHIQTTLRPYVKCVNESGGADDCTLEFKQLERAQKRFDDAVLAIRLQCRVDRLPRMGDAN